MRLTLAIMSSLLYIKSCKHDKRGDDVAGQPNMVRKWRRWREWSQGELAERVGVSRQTIANIERGNYSPSVHLALDICHELNKTVEEIFGAEQHD